MEVTRALNRTQGLRAVLDRYHTLYADALQSGARFTFDDLSRLLGSDTLILSSNPDATNRLYIDYRLDGKLLGTSFQMPCPPVAALIVGFVLYVVLAKAGLESKTLEMPAAKQ